MENNLPEIFLDFTKRHWIVMLLGLAGFVFIVCGLISLLYSSPKANDIKFETESSSKTDFSQSLMAIDIEGEVANPGVYKLKKDSIAQDALVAAGGLTAQADRKWVSKNLNLALKLSDSQKIYIPQEGEITQSLSSESTLGISISSKNTSGSLININSAASQDLDSLPGIGPVTSAKIISNRPYATIDDLLTKKSVSKKVFEQIKDKIIAQ